MDDRLAFNGSGTIYFFVGEAPPPNIATSDYLSYPTLAGVNHIFAAPTEACDNCGNQQNQAHLVTDTAPITPILLDYIQVGQLDDLTVRNVKPFLIKHLKWRIVTVSLVQCHVVFDKAVLTRKCVQVNGDPIDPRDLSSLKIGVSSKLTPANGGDVKYQEFPDIIEAIIENAS
jgi:tyrosinase